MCKKTENKQKWDKTCNIAQNHTKMSCKTEQLEQLKTKITTGGV